MVVFHRTATAAGEEDGGRTRRVEREGRGGERADEERGEVEWRRCVEWLLLVVGWLRLLSPTGLALAPLRAVTRNQALFILIISVTVLTLT